MKLRMTVTVLVLRGRLSDLRARYRRASGFQKGGLIPNFFKLDSYTHKIGRMDVMRITL